jgi:hypothetical protein
MDTTTGKPSTINELLDGLTYNDGTKNYTYASSTTGGVTTYYEVSKFSKGTEATEALKTLNEELLELSYSYVDYNKLAELIMNQNELTANEKTNYSAFLTDAAISAANDYSTTRNNFFDLIFDAKSIDTVKELISKGTISETSLSDVDYVLTACKENELTISEQFKTVVKSYFVDKMIEETGEPKYAWIDSTDTQNTGNADSKAQWYTNLFTRMQQGYKTLENGLANSTQWLEYALESGIVTMEQVDKSYNWDSLDYKACTRITEVTDDAAVAKAEAEYNRAMNDIESKDNIYDIQLKNIDTEHTALQTEYDSIKTVISKNIERNFKFNQSA